MTSQAIGLAVSSAVPTYKTVKRRTPPFSQMDRGAVDGLLRASKNQNLSQPLQKQLLYSHPKKGHTTCFVWLSDQHSQTPEIRLV